MHDHSAEHFPVYPKPISWLIQGDRSVVVKIGIARLFTERYYDKNRDAYILRMPELFLLLGSIKDHLYNLGAAQQCYIKYRILKNEY
ncbi:MAG: hypothetical protein ACI86X_001288 [Moritella sp.]|jgi:hypothetical protein